MTSHINITQEAINKALRQLEQLRKNLPKPTAFDLVVLYLKRNAA